MFTFHEGLPGCGKSYEAMVKQIIPALTKKRKVFARINGLNYEQIAELAGLTEDECKELLIHVSEEDTPRIYEIAEKDSLIILDELQDFWPSRSKPPQEIMQWVAKHRHDGQDIIGMGQSLADVHHLWRRRCERKLQFQKLSMLGTDKRYKWTMNQGVPNAKGEVEFRKLKTGTTTYDPKYYGSYASHSVDTENTGTYQDARLNVFNTGLFKYVIPASVIACGFAIYHLSGFFDSEKAVERAKDHELHQPQQQQPQKRTLMAQQQYQQGAATNQHPQRNPNGQTRQNNPPPPPQSSNNNRYRDLVESYDEEYKARLSYVDLDGSRVQDAIIEWVDEADRVMHRLYASQIASLGYSLAWNGVGVTTKKKDKIISIYVFEPVLDTFASVPDDTAERL